MTCTTFLHDSELNQPLPDRELQNLLDEIRTQTAQNWQVVHHPQLTPNKWLSRFRSPSEPLYGLYLYVGGCGPWQQINFFDNKSNSSINLYVPLAQIAAYLMGIASGLYFYQQQQKYKNESN